MTPNDQPQWWALKVFRNQTGKLQKLLQKNGFETFIPIQTIVTENEQGKKIEKTRPAVAGLLFVKAPLQYISSTKNKNTTPEFIFYTHLNNENKRVPAPILNAEMERFKIVANAFITGIEYIDPIAASQILSEGNKVRVKAGIFEGAEGVIKRIKGSKRLIVEIKGVCAIATPYIPPVFLEPID